MSRGRIAGSEEVGPARSLCRRAWSAATSRPVLSVILVALAARIVLASAVFIAEDGIIFSDDSFYARLATDMATGRNALWDDYDRQVYRRTGSLLWPLTGIFWAFGSVNLLGQLFVAGLGAATAGFTTMLARRVLPVASALTAGLIVALLPSQVVWSSLMLKDAVVWAALSGLAVVVAVANKAHGRRLGILGTAAVLLLVVIAFLRLQTLEIALVAVVVACAMGSPPWRSVRLGVAVAILLGLPVAFGMGVGGASFVAHSSGDLDTRRVNNAQSAQSAIIEVKTVPEAAATPAQGALNSPATPRAPAAPPPATPRAPAAPPPATPRAPAAPPPPTPTPVTDSGLRSQLSYLPTGLVAVGLRPFPWEANSGSSSALRLASIESVIWYVLCLLALVGAWALRRSLADMSFPCLVLAGALLMYALTEGNLGTAFRHRGEAVWVVAILAAAGLSVLAPRWSARRRRGTADRA